MTRTNDYWSMAADRRLSRRTVLRAGAAGAGIAGLAAAGCGAAPKSGGGAAKPASGPSAASDSGLKPGNLKTGGTLQLQQNSVSSLDPYYNSSFLPLYPV